MKVLSVGDIHGRQIWKRALFGSDNKFAEWRESTYERKFISWENVLDKSLGKIDKVVFIGDYLDSFTELNVVIKSNFLDILAFKEMYPENVVLLWGNHEVHYWKTGMYPRRYDGFRTEMYNDFYDIFRENHEMLTFAFQIGNVLWTHAGVTQGFYNHHCVPGAEESEASVKRWEMVSDNKFDHFNLTPLSLEEFLNNMWKLNWDALFNVSWKRKGISEFPSPIWAHESELLHDPIEGLFQVVGHTPLDYVKGSWNDKTGTFFIDCLSGLEPALLIVELNEYGMYKDHDIHIIDK